MIKRLSITQSMYILIFNKDTKESADDKADSHRKGDLGSKAGARRIPIHYSFFPCVLYLMARHSAYQTFQF